ncbi:hypothetical protein LTR97_004474 [Elasticomyces elasticus]|uniref:Uncharacterized protein n=1 Tax=Elasticomyces elasticus TaxID=574655 RepID=A0AAN7VSN9_9PEZI|nr:hypothetical protein LTR97_004474 [Elasticomyces elasticus]
MASTDRHYKRAVREGFQSIDRNLGKYLTDTKQKSWATRLIEKCKLKETKSKSVGGAEDAMTEDRLLSILKNTVKNHPRPDNPFQAATDLWTKGSVLVCKLYLGTVHSRPKRSYKIKIKSTKMNSKAATAPASAADTKSSATTENCPPESSKNPSCSSATVSPEQSSSGAEWSHTSEPSAVGVLGGKQETVCKGDQSKELPENDAHIGYSDGTSTDLSNEQSEVPMESESTETRGLATFLPDEQIGNVLFDIRKAIQDIAHLALDESSNVKAGWVAEPEESLRRLYDLSIPAGYEHRELKLDEKIIKGQDMLKACLSAAVFHYVLGRDLPWEGPAEEFARDSNVAVSDRVLQLVGCPLTYEQFLWKRAATKLDRGLDVEFMDKYLHGIAEELSWKILVVLGPQLDIIGASARAHLIRPALSKIILKALVIKGKTRVALVAPDEFVFEWVKGGKEFDGSRMERVGMVSERLEVLWYNTPVVMARESKQGKYEVAVKSNVVAGPWPVDRQ